MKKGGILSAKNFSARNIKYGVREFAMGAINSGLALTDITRPYCGTFLTFSDYMRNAIRLASLMQLPVVYQFTHDSVFLGEDGPTHQPIEHLASLRAIPNLIVLRPADTTELKASWAIALKQKRPVALILSRQSVLDLQTSYEGVEKGAYIVQSSTEAFPDFCLLSTGSELSLALDVAKILKEKYDKTVKVVSFPSWELFEEQPREYQNQILKAKKMVVIEAQSQIGWHRYVGKDGLCITVDSFGKSAPAKSLADYFGFTPDAIVSRCLQEDYLE
jgi:transketolase